MTGRGYERLDILAFGRALLESNDLDPVYVALSAVDWPRETRHRFLVAYWCFYSCGVSSWLAEREGEEFWEMMEVAARNEQLTPLDGRWPRGSERRHFRGKAAINSVADLRYHFPLKPEAMVTACASEAPDIGAVIAHVKQYKGFGPWIGFKIADMLERIEGVHIDFTEAAVFMFPDPVKAALMLWKSHHGLPETAKPKDQTRVINEVVAHLSEAFADCMAPPGMDRPVGLQEVETILCKWKSHMNGHYPLFNDTAEISEDVDEWTPFSSLAVDFLKGMPGS